MTTNSRKVKGDLLENKVLRLFKRMGYKVDKNIRKHGSSGTLHEIDILAVYDTPLYKSTVIIECKEHENSIGKEVVMKLESIIRDVGADKGIIISTGGFTRGALSYAKNLNIELWSRVRLNKEIEKVTDEEKGTGSIEEDVDLLGVAEEDNESKLEITDTGFIGEIRGTFRIFFKVQNNSFHTIRNLQAELNLKNEEGRLLDTKKQKMGTVRPETIETYTTRFQTHYGKLNVEVIIYDDETEYVRESLNYEINKPMCFIATAAYCTPFAEEIDVLRIWRDNRLSKIFLGRFFISTYYSISPPIAKIISKSNILRFVIRISLKPLLLMLRYNR